MAKSKIIQINKEVLFGFVENMLNYYRQHMMREHVWQYPFGRAEGRAIKAWLAFADAYTEVEWQKPDQYQKLNGANPNEVDRLKRFMFAWNGISGNPANNMSNDLRNDFMIRMGQSLQIVSSMPVSYTHLPLPTTPYV